MTCIGKTGAQVSFIECALAEHFGIVYPEQFKHEIAEEKPPPRSTPMKM